MFERHGLPSLWLAVTASACGVSDSNAGVIGTPFTVWVFDERETSDGEDKPVAGARVAFDVPSGGSAPPSRVVKTTAPDGHVTFEGDFSRGGVSVTVFSDSHVYVTMLEASPENAQKRPNAIGKPAADLVVFPPRLDPVTESRTVSVRGNIAGKRDPSDVVSLAVSSMPRLGSVEARDASYVLRVPRERPFFMVGHETKLTAHTEGFFTREQVVSFRLDLPARSGDELLDLDLATIARLPVRTLALRAEVPEAARAFFGAGTVATAAISSKDSQVALAVLLSATPRNEGRAFDVELAAADTDPSPERTVTEVTLKAPDGSHSTRAEQGSPDTGATWTDFAPPPLIAEPEKSRTVREPIPLGGFPQGADLLAHVYAAGSLLWILRGPPGGPREKSFVIPYRDEIHVPLVAVFALSLSAQRDRVALPPHREFYRYVSTYRDILLRK